MMCIVAFKVDVERSSFTIVFLRRNFLFASSLTCCRMYLLVTKCTKKTRKLSYRKDNRAMCPIYECPEKFSWVPDYAHGYFSRNF